MYITIKDAMEVQPFSKSKIIAGENGTDRHIELFGILDAPDSVQFVKQNEFAMTTGYIFKEHPEAQEKIIQELYQRGSAGLGIKMHRYINDISLKAKQFANKNGFPILSLPNEYSWYDLSSSLLLQVIDTKDHINNILESTKEFSDKMVHTNNLNGFLELLTNLVKRPCSLYNKISKELLNYPNEFVPTRDIDSIIEGANCPPILLFPNSDMYRITNFDGNNNYAIITQVSYRKENFRKILIWEGTEKLSQDALLALRYAIMSINLNIKNFNDLNPNLFIDRNDFLIELVFGNIENYNSALINASQLNIDLKEDYIVCVAEVTVKDLSKHISNLKDDNLNKLYEYHTLVCKELNFLGGFSKSNELFVLIPVSPNIDKEKETKISKAKIKEIKMKLENKFPSVVINFGIGKFYPKLSGLKTSYHEALETIKISKSINNQNFITHFRDLGVYRLLSKLTNTSAIKYYVDDYINDIVLFDNENKTNLLETLKIFMECNRSYRQCAQKMFVHHNTIRYRLQQIEKICGIDINSSEDLLVLEIALKILALEGYQSN